MAIDGPESGVVVRGLLAAAAAVNLVGVRATFAAPIARLAPDCAPDGKPEASLRRLAGMMRAILAGARVVCPGWVVNNLPSVGGLPAAPLRQQAVDGIPRLGVDKTAVRGGCNDQAQE